MRLARSPPGSIRVGQYPLMILFTQNCPEKFSTPKVARLRRFARSQWRSVPGSTQRRHTQASQC
jgi:hypothetical protein